MNFITMLAKILRDKVVFDVGGQKPTNGHINMGAYALKSDLLPLQSQISGGLNLELITTETQGYYIDSNGTLTASSQSTTSDFIAIDPSKSYTLQYWPDTSTNKNSWIGATFWDADKAFISYLSWDTSITPVDYRLISGSKFAVPSNVAYVRISYYNWADSITHIRLNEGSYVALPWDLNPADLLATFYKNNGGTTA